MRAFCFVQEGKKEGNKSIQSLYRQFEAEKKKIYGERIREVEHGSFTLLVFSTSGGMGPEAKIAINNTLAATLAKKLVERYNHIVHWMLCYIAFSLAWSAI